MCGAPANSTGWVDPGWLNYAALTGLQPGTRYYYAVGDPVSQHPSVQDLHVPKAWNKVSMRLSLGLILLIWPVQGPVRALYAASMLVWSA